MPKTINNKIYNPFLKENWFDVLIEENLEVKFLALKTLQEFKLLHKKPDFNLNFEAIKSTIESLFNKEKLATFRLFLKYNTVLAVSLLAVFAVTVSASVAQIFAPEEYKPSTFLQKLSPSTDRDSELKTNQGCFNNSENEAATPLNQFKAEYYNDDEFICAENVSTINKSYAFSEFKDIPARNFKAKYSGQFEFQNDTLKNITFSASWSKIIIKIDGQVVVEKENDSGSLLYTFKQGSHLIEVEYENNWHTVGYSVQFLDPVETVTLNSLKQKYNFADYNFWYAGAYEGGRNYQVDLLVRESDKPIILLLNSYASVLWNLVGPGAEQVELVILNSYEPGSNAYNTFNKNLEGTKITVLAQSQLQAYTYNLLPECSLQPTGPYCSNKGFYEVAKILEEKLGVLPNGFSGEYNPEGLQIPVETLDAKAYKKLELESNEIINNPKEKERPEDDCVRIGEDLICGGEGNDLIS